MTRTEFDEIVKQTCPHCAAGVVVRQRTDTKEWIHDFATIVGPLSKRHGHTLCLASYLRNSWTAENLT